MIRYRPMATTSAPHSSGKGNGLAFLFFLALGLALVIAGVSVSCEVTGELQLHFRSAGWIKVPAKILGVEGTVTQRRRRSTHHITARYEYVVDGKTYTGTRVSVDAGAQDSGLSESRFRELQEHRTSGQPVTAWIDPADPTSALLYRDVGWNSVTVLPFGLVFASLGLGLCVVALDLRRDRGRSPFVLFSTRWISIYIGWWLSVTGLAASGLLLFMLSLDSRSPTEAWVAAGTLVLGAVVAVFKMAVTTSDASRHGHPRLMLRQHPIPVGGSLEAILVIEPELVTSVIEITLTCLNGKSIEFAKSDRVPVPRDASRPGTTRIPLSLEIPAGSPPRGGGDGRRFIRWNLRAEAKDAGFSAVFADLPVELLDDPKLAETNPEWR